jgi:hypothetical protein
MLRSKAEAHPLYDPEGIESRTCLGSPTGIASNQRAEETKYLYPASHAEQLKNGLGSHQHNTNVADIRSSWAGDYKVICLEEMK